MEQQIFINEIKATFNLREPKGTKPTNVYLIVRMNRKQVKFATGVKVYPDHWNKEKQEAYVSFRLSELDNRNNEIANNKINELKVCFSEYKKYLCDNPDEIESSFALLKKHIYKNSNIRRMEKKQDISATNQMFQFISELDIKESSKDVKRGVIKLFALFLKDNKIIDCWNNMNLDTLNKYQNYLISNKKNISTIGNHFNVIKSILRIANKRIDIPFKWSDNNLDSFEVIKDKANKTKRDEKKVALTMEQVKQIYAYEPKGKNAERNTEIKDMFVLQCLVGQRISDIPKFIKGEYEINNDIISIIQQKTGEIAIIPLFNEAKEILYKYKDGLKYPIILEKRRNALYNSTIKGICRDLCFNEEIEYQEQRGSKIETIKAPLYELIHSHTARHTFITILCRMDIPKDTIIIATGHADTTMIDEVCEHLNEKDKSNKIKKAISNKIGNSFFNVQRNDIIDKQVNNYNKHNCEILFNDIDVYKYLFITNCIVEEIQYNNEVYTLKQICDYLQTEKGKKDRYNLIKQVLKSFVSYDSFIKDFYDISLMEYTTCDHNERITAEVDGNIVELEEILDIDEIQNLYKERYIINRCGELGINIEEVRKHLNKHITNN